MAESHRIGALEAQQGEENSMKDEQATHSLTVALKQLEYAQHNIRFVWRWATRHDSNLEIGTHDLLTQTESVRAALASLVDVRRAREEKK